MNKVNGTTITSAQQKELIRVLKDRFNKNMHLHKNLTWIDIESKLSSKKEKLWSVFEMERTGGEPDVIGQDKKTREYIFCDCAVESPAGRRSLCYDRDGLDSRKEFKPENSAIDLADEMGIELLTEEQYRDLQKLGKFDSKTSSWLKTPTAIRKLGGSIFGDFRFGTVFVYHNGPQSYYAGRGFRGILRV